MSTIVQTQTSASHSRASVVQATTSTTFHRGLHICLCKAQCGLLEVPVQQQAYRSHAKTQYSTQAPSTIQARSFCDGPHSSFEVLIPVVLVDLMHLWWGWGFADYCILRLLLQLHYPGTHTRVLEYRHMLHVPGCTVQPPPVPRPGEAPGG